MVVVLEPRMSANRLVRDCLEERVASMVEAVGGGVVGGSFDGTGYWVTCR